MGVFEAWVLAAALVLIGSGGGAGPVWADGQQEAASTVQLPDTPAGKRMKALLAAFDAGVGALRGFIAENYAKSALEQRPVESRARAYGNIYADTGGFVVRAIGEAEGNSAAVYAQDRITGDWYRLSVEVEPGEPHGILGFGSQRIDAPEKFRARGKLSDADLARQIEEYVAKLVAADRFSGAVLVSREGRTVFRKAWGQASRSFSAPNRVDTKFNLGSMNKMFTAVAIAQLAQAGKLQFSDPVGKHVPDWPNAAVREKVTLHHLLTHTSGMGNYFNETYRKAGKEQFRRVRDYRPLYAEQALEFEPGERWSYSNSGFMLLGEIVEAASGEDYFEYVRKHVTGPLGMSNTDCYEMDHDTPNLAVGYTNQGPHPLPAGERWNNLYLHVVKGGPAGGCFSTVEDLVKFAGGLRGEKLLDASHTRAMTTGKVAPAPEDASTKYAYGIQEELVGTERILGHGGGFPGINGQLDIYWNAGHAVAVLANYDPPAAGRVADKIRSLLLQE
jgi:CubicO group peptidase (beta-lactamase class C family)